MIISTRSITLTSSSVPGNKEETIEVVLPEPFSPGNLLVPRTCSPFFLVLRLAVDGKTIFSGEYPADAFSVDLRRSLRIRWPHHQLTKGQHVSLTVRNLYDEDRRFSAILTEKDELQEGT